MFFGAIAVAFIIFFIGKWFLKETYDGTKEIVDSGHSYVVPIIIIAAIISSVPSCTLSFPEVMAGVVSIIFFIEFMKEDDLGPFGAISFPACFYFFHVYLGINGLGSFICSFPSCAVIIFIEAIIIDSLTPSESSTVVSDKVK